MKTSNHWMPALFLLALLGFFALAYLTPVGEVMAEGGAAAVETASIQTASDNGQAQARRCENREVEADEGYGVSHKEIRRICE